MIADHSTVVLPSGAYVALMESEPFLSLFGRKSSAPLRCYQEMYG